MQIETKNPATGADAVARSMNAFRAGSDMDITTRKPALKVILERVAVSEPVAAVLAAHAGLGPKAVR